MIMILYRSHDYGITIPFFLDTSSIKWVKYMRRIAIYILVEKSHKLVGD